ncbi:MAG: cellulase family glycosylhydrolase [Deltaproteobacteria bacterium]|nr:cellulase family glycosylhydrolase [Deltaproteobacteria bacterium]
MYRIIFFGLLIGMLTLGCDDGGNGDSVGDSGDTSASDDTANDKDGTDDTANGKDGTDDTNKDTDDTDEVTDDTDIVGDCSNVGDGVNPGRVCIRGKSYYLNGINVAWDQWDADLTDYDETAFEGMFATLEASGANAIRWWWFIDAQGQLNFDGNMVQQLDSRIFDNLDKAFDAAADHGVLIMPVFLSFDIQSAGNTFLVTDDDAIDAFNLNVVTPIVQRYADHPGMGVWEIMNEPDWLLDSESGTVSMAQLQRFQGKVAAAIHAADSDALVTTGMGMFKYMTDGDNNFSDAALQAAADDDPLAYFDVFQTHYYSWQHGDGWSYEPWIKTSTAWLPHNKPVLIGEFPCKGEEGVWSSLEMHTEAIAQGYAGTFCWAYFDNRKDKEGYWVDAKPGIEAIAAAIPNAISGE